MNPVLTTKGAVSCLRGGKVKLTSQSTLLKINGAVALCARDVVGAEVKYCPPDQNGRSCHNVATLTAGVSTKLFVDGKPVLLAGKVIGTTDYPESLSAEAGQTILLAT